MNVEDQKRLGKDSTLKSLKSRDGQLRVCTAPSPRNSAPTVPTTFEIPFQLRCNSNEKKRQLRVGVAHLCLRVNTSACVAHSKM
jgi:hypothetical protein